ncbi:S41 family peptidase [Maribacter sp.]|nr:S41 family peptidase [Maribacter sp.]
MRDSSSVKSAVIDSAKVTQVVKLTKAEKAANKLQRKKRKKDNKKFGRIARGNLYTRNFKFLDATAKIAYLQLRSWGNGPYNKFYKESFSKLDSAKSTTLIIDLRNNTGGRLDEVKKLYSYLTDSDFVLVKPAKIKTRLPYVKSFYGPDSGLFSVLGETIVWPFFSVHNLFKARKKEGQLLFHYGFAKKSKPNALNFKGEIYVLINGTSFSASSIFATKLHGTKRATFVGEETGGTYNGTVAGHFKRISLPNSKIRYRVGLMQIETAHTQQPDGYGLQPDVTIIPTKADILAERDPELEQVLAMIQQGRQ